MLVWLLGGLSLLRTSAAGERVVPPGPALASPTSVSPGLARADLREGDGASLGDGDLAVVEFTGWFADGEVWDSTLQRPGPARILLGDRRTPGIWAEGLSGMRTGGVRQLVLTDPDAAPEDGTAAGSLTIEFELVQTRRPPEAPLPLAPGSERDIAGYAAADLRVGSGAEALPGRRVSVDYVLWLADGTKIDSSWRWPEPLTFVFGEPSGAGLRWEAPLSEMRAGGRRQVRIPPELGFGAEGRKKIPPDTELILTFDLVAVEPAAP